MNALTATQKGLLKGYDPALQTAGLAPLLDLIIAAINVIADALGGCHLLTKAVLAIATAKDDVKSGAFDYVINGQKYTKAAADGTALTAGTVPQNKYAAYRFQIGIDGTIDVVACAAHTTGYDSAAEAIAALPTTGLTDHAVMGILSVVCTEETGFVAGTTTLDGTGVTASFTQATTALELIGAL